MRNYREPAWHNQVRLLRRQGMTYQQIADRLYISTTSVGSVVRADKLRDQRQQEFFARLNEKNSAA